MDIRQFGREEILLEKPRYSALTGKDRRNEEGRVFRTRFSAGYGAAGENGMSSIDVSFCGTQKDKTLSIFSGTCWLWYIFFGEMSI